MTLRCGVPFYLSHTIVAADGDDHVTGVTIGEVDANWQVIPGTEKHFDVDTICLAVGLSPMSKLCDMAGCQMEDNPAKAGFVSVVNAYGETSVPGIYAAGDVSGIEEASSAMIEGRIAELRRQHGLAISLKKRAKQKLQNKKLHWKDCGRGCSHRACAARRSQKPKRASRFRKTC